MDTQAYLLPSNLFPLANALPNGIALHRDGKVLFANKVFSQLTGYAHDDLARLDFGALFPPEIQAQGRARQCPDGAPAAARYEALVHTRNGEARWVELNLSQQSIE
ncbi:MAG: PAS domain-containing protein, partial [Zoogloea sp.]|nr:PAS domain-containing protein [Zoogloea sp.]